MDSFHQGFVFAHLYLELWTPFFHYIMYFYKQLASLFTFVMLPLHTIMHFHIPLCPILQPYNNLFTFTDIHCILGTITDVFVPLCNFLHLYVPLGILGTLPTLCTFSIALQNWWP